MTATTTTKAREQLVPLARSLFGLEVAQLLPVTESFSSQVLRFVDRRGEAYVIKEPWSATKAVREVHALRRLSAHPLTPTLIDHRQHGARHLLLLRGIDGEPMSSDAPMTEPLARAIGEALALLHALPEPDFDGAPTWRALLRRNAELYRADIGTADKPAADRAHSLLLANLSAVPDSALAVMVHFDLRPGNLLIRDDHLVGLIDFEACRGGHPSMDLFKLWEELRGRHPESLQWVLRGYGGDAGWMRQALPLMQVYSLYHGLAGLAWCYRRGRPEDPFIDRNRRLIAGAERALGRPR